jgi:hypothetical protein
MENLSYSDIHAQLSALSPMYAEVAAKKAAEFGIVMRCEFMCAMHGGAKKIVRNENGIIVAKWASHPYVTGSIQDYAEEIMRIIGIFTAPNAPIEHKEIDAESVTIHEDSAIRHAEKIVQSGRLQYRKTTHLYVQDTITKLAVTVHSDTLNLWELQAAAHIKLAAYIERAKEESHNVK